MAFDIAFPENVKRGQGPRPLRFKQLLAVAYCFGGVYALSYLLSKFVVTPLVEQLTFERRLMVEEARERQTRLNILISQLISHDPAVKVRNYVERVVSARDAKTQTVFEKQAHEEADNYRKQLKEMSAEIKQCDFDNDLFSTNAQIIKAADEFIKYARQLQFETPPTQLSFVLEDDKTTPLLKSVSEFKQEIRAVKSALLSS